MDPTENEEDKEDEMNTVDYHFKYSDQEDEYDGDNNTLTYGYCGDCIEVLKAECENDSKNMKKLEFIIECIEKIKDLML